MIMKEFLERKCVCMKESDQLLMGYWMVEYFKLSKETSKSELDGIIDPKLNITKSFLE